jgi:hypothetical protein
MHYESIAVERELSKLPQAVKLLACILEVSVRILACTPTIIIIASRGFRQFFQIQFI